MTAGAAPGSAEARPRERERKQRKTEVERRLEAAGFVRSPTRERPRWLEPEQRTRQTALASTLRSLGPLYALLGRYLSTRLDQVPGDTAAELARIPDSADPLSGDEVRALVRSELGEAGQVALSRLDPAPRASSLLFQVHEGRLADGMPVIVKLARTAVSDGVDRDVLKELSPHLSSTGWTLDGVERMLADFDDVLTRISDLRREATTLESLGRLPGEGWRFRTARVLPVLSSTHILTVEPPPGRLLGWEARPGDGTAAGDVAAARRSADLWLKLAVEGRLVSEQTAATDLRLAAAGHLLVLGGLYREVASEQAELLLDYLVAAAREDAEGVFSALRQLCTSGEGARTDALRQQLGHAVPRRDGRFGPAGIGLPELLLAHWLELERQGLRPLPALVSFYRGLVDLRERAGVALSEGVLHESLQVVRVARGARRLSESLDPALVQRGAAGVATALADLPGRIERSGWLEGRAPEATEAAPAPAPPARRSGSRPLAAGLLLLATTFAWLQRLSGSLGPWGETLQAVAVGALGALLLWFAWRA